MKNRKARDIHQTLPNSVEAEQAILGAILRENESVKECSQVIGVEDFYNDGHKIIFQALMDLLEIGKVDQVILYDHLKNNGNLDKVGGPSYLSSLADNVISAANISHHAKIVKDKSLLRTLITTTEDIQLRAYANNGDRPQDILDAGKQAFSRISAEDDRGLKFINASTWLESEPLKPDQIVENTFDAGDKVAIIGSSKLMKSFFLQQALLCFSTGKPFLHWNVPTPRRCSHIQYEIKANHEHRRLKYMVRGLDITPSDMGDRLQILNSRGLELTGSQGLKKIKQAISRHKPEIISFDPLYKVSDGIENAIEGMKIILNAFDVLAEETGAAILYVHHDSKGMSGDRDIRDRGAGSNVLGRDYDACFTLTAHASDPDAIVIETLLRNYRPQEPFTIQFTETEDSGGYRFELRHDILATKKTSANAKQAPPVDTYLPVALEILKDGMMEVSLFKDKLKKSAGISDNRVDSFISWASAGGNPKLETKSERGRGKNKKWIALQGTFKE